MNKFKKLSTIFTGAVVASFMFAHEAGAQDKTPKQFPHNPNGPDIAFLVHNIDERKSMKLPIDVDPLGENGELTAEFLGQFDIDFYKFVNVQVNEGTVEHQRTYRLASRILTDDEAKNIALMVQHLVNNEKLDGDKFVTLLTQDMAEGAEGLKTINCILNAEHHRKTNPQLAQQNVTKVWNHLAIHMTEEQHAQLKTRIERLVKAAAPVLKTYRAQQSSSSSSTHTSDTVHAVPGSRSPR